ncbi:MAG: hypothetical protein U0694_20905 [Anaerolineae bacterium]
MLTHSGDSYAARSHEELQALYDLTVSRFQALRQALGVDLELSIGDTPCCSVVEDLSAVSEIRPGNFVYYDVMQVIIGSCMGRCRWCRAGLPCRRQKRPAQGNRHSRRRRSPLEGPICRSARAQASA